MLNFQKYNDIHKLSFVFKKEITNSLEFIEMRSIIWR